MASRILSRLSRGAGAAHRLMSAPLAGQERLGCFSSGFPSLMDATVIPSAKWMPSLPCHMTQLFELQNLGLQRFGFSSSSCPQPNEEANEFSDEKRTVGQHDTVSMNGAQAEAGSGSVKASDGAHSPEQTQDVGSTDSKSHSTGRRRRRRSPKRTAFSDSDTEPGLSIDDLVKLVAEKEELLKLKHKEIEKMQEKVLLSYADMENVIDRTKREAENSKKFAIQTFAKSLLDVADNMERASSVVKESFSKIDSSKDSSGAVQLLRTLLEGVEMTEKQLMEVFKKFGVERFDPTNEQFDPHRHHALFQVPDPSKPSGTVAVVLKPGYMLYDRVLRPAEVGVTEAVNDEVNQNSAE